MNRNKPSSNSKPIKRHIILPQNPTTTLIEKNLNYLGIKNTIHTTKTIKQIAKNKSQNRDSISNTSVYKIHCLNYINFYIGETSRNFNKRIYEHKKSLKLVK